MSTASLLGILASVTVTALAQLCLKLASSRYAGPMFGEGFVGSVVSQVLHPLTLVAMLAYALSLVLWLLALRNVPLSVAYPFAGLTLALVSLLGIIGLGEPVSATKLIGIGLIIVGTIVLARA